MRYRPRKRKKKKFSSEFRSHLTSARKLRKKIQKIEKTPFRHYFSPERDKIGRERKKKILVPNSVHTRPGQENSEKNRKKIKKLKNLFPALFLAKTG